MTRKKYAVIVAGGSGTRMGSVIPKQFSEVDGKPILRHTIEHFQSLSFKVEIVVGLPDEHKEYWKNYCRESGFLSRYSIPSGGITRFHSVKNALQHVPDGAVVAVHDGVRPCVTTDFLEKMFLAGEKYPAVIPVVKPVESVREILPSCAGLHTCSVDRDKFFLVQTPQVFHSEVLKRAYDQPFNSRFTDDASVVESIGIEIYTEEGIRRNIKVTTPDDILLMKAFMQTASDRGL